MERRKFGTPVMLALILIVAAIGFTGNAFATPPIGDQGGKSLSTVLAGANEVPSPTTGDPDGSGTARITLNYGQSTVCWQIAAANISSVVGAHIHRAPAGVNGPIVVHLTAVAGGTLTGCVEEDQAEIKDIIQHPENYYVNVHSTEYTGGAIRGQLG